MINKEFERLNQNQLKAVNSVYGPIMVVAGPGTGKTQIIALRTANIILKTGINPENILITTFTEAGVIAIKKRLTKFIGTDAYKVCVSTIHSFAQDIISSFPEKFIKQKAGSTIDDIESLEVLTNIIDQNIKKGTLEHLFTPFDRYFYLRDIKDRIGKLKGEGVNPNKFKKIISNLNQEYLNKLEELKHNKRIRNLETRTNKDKKTYDKHIGKLNELNFIYKEYQKYLNNNSLYDFSDMINFVVEKLKIDNELTSFYAEKFQFIMLDEYQDTNNPQNNIMNLIMEIGEEKNIMVVGDDDQSIYRFQGANIENMLNFYTIYPQTQFIVLENNYRSSQSILDLSDNLINNNNERLVNRLDFLDKKLIAFAPYKDFEKNTYNILPDSETEKIFVINKIKEKLKNQNTQEESIAIIVRSNREVEEWTNFILNEAIEVESKLKTNILNNKFVEFIINFLNFIENPFFDDSKLLNILRSELIDIENIDVINISRELYKQNYSRYKFKLTLWDIIKNIEDYKNINYINIQKIINFKNMILELHGELGMYGISRLFQKILNNLGIIDFIEKNSSFSDLEDVYTLFNKIKEYNSNNPDLNLQLLLNKFNLHKKFKLSISRQILKKTNSNIEILTAHSSKGLEYDTVFIPGVYSGNWENKRVVDKLKLPIGVAGNGLQYSNLSEKELKNLEKEIAKQEDRRLFFVALTRAKKELIFTRPAGKDNKPFIDSPFIIELGISSNVIKESLKDNLLLNSIKNQILGNNNLIKVTNEEINYISTFLQKYKLSATDLNLFLEDPKLFLQNVIFKYPFVDNEFTIFGKVYHKVLELITLKKMLGENILLKDVLNLFNESLNKQTLTHEEKIRLTKKGVEGLTGYYDIFIKNPRVSLTTEYNFRPRNIVFEGIPITGKIDKIEKINTVLLETNSIKNKKNNLGQIPLFVDDIAIIDYKTGSIKSIGAVKGIDKYGNKKAGTENGKYFRQVLFYKLLGENDNEFSSKFNIEELALDFVEGKDGNYKYLPINFENQDWEDFKILVKDSWQKINDLNFWEKILNE